MKGRSPLPGSLGIRCAGGMTEYSALLDLSAALVAPDRCPWCAAGLRAVSDGDRTNFFCASCRRCWHVELGRVVKVDAHAGTSRAQREARPDTAAPGGLTEAGRASSPNGGRTCASG